MISLFNMSHVQQCSVKINLAGKAMTIKATHSGYKSYYIKAELSEQKHNAELAKAAAQLAAVQAAAELDKQKLAADKAGTELTAANWLLQLQPLILRILTNQVPEALLSTAALNFMK